MSIDKLKTVFPVSVGFVAGEQPNDRKLSGWGTQDKNAFTAVEKALGDLLDTNSHTGTNGGSHTYTLSDRKLGIASLGRLVGPSGWLNPEFPTRHGTFTVTVTLRCEAGTPFARCWVLPLKPRTYDSATGTWSNSTITPGGGEVASFADRKTVLSSVVQAGDYYVDFDGGYVYSYTGIDNGTTATLEYATSMLPDLYEEASFNVIPDWNESTTLCSIASSGTGYTVTCPVMNVGVWRNVATTGDMTLGPLGDLSQSNRSTLYESSNGNLADVDDPRNSTALTLPFCLRDELLSGDDIPEGFMFLYDNTIGAVIEGCTFEYRSATQVFVQPPAGVTLVIGSARYRLLTVGTNIAEALKAVAMRTLWHSHDGLHGEQLISHSVLIDRFKLTDDPGEQDLYYESTRGVIENPHPQYLHRSGWYSSDHDEPRNSGNAVRGDLVISSESTLNDWMNTATLAVDSFRLYFGGHPDVTTPAAAWIQLAVNGSADSAIVGTLGMMVLGGTKVQAKEGLASGDHLSTVDGVVVRSSSFKWLTVGPLTYGDASGTVTMSVVANTVTSAAGVTYDYVSWSIPSANFPSDFVNAGILNIRVGSIVIEDQEYDSAISWGTGFTTDDTGSEVTGTDELRASGAGTGHFIKLVGIADVGSNILIRAAIGEAVATDAPIYVTIGYVV